MYQNYALTNHERTLSLIKYNVSFHASFQNKCTVSQAIVKQFIINTKIIYENLNDVLKSFRKDTYHTLLKSDSALDSLKRHASID